MPTEKQISILTPTNKLYRHFFELFNVQEFSSLDFRITYLRERLQFPEIDLRKFATNNTNFINSHHLVDGKNEDWADFLQVYSGPSQVQLQIWENLFKNFDQWRETNFFFVPPMINQMQYVYYQSESYHDLIYFPRSHAMTSLVVQGCVLAMPINFYDFYQINPVMNLYFPQQSNHFEVLLLGEQTQLSEVFDCHLQQH